MRLAVPLYVHPAIDRRPWQAMVRDAALVAWVVANAADGPGRGRDFVLAAPIADLIDAGVEVIGYVDSRYGWRPRGELLDDLARWEEWYGVSGILLDQAPSGRGRWAAAAVRALREAGAGVVVANPGVHAVQPTGASFDWVVTFEGPGDSHERVPASPSPRARTGGTCHLVHSAPRGTLAGALGRARRAGATAIWVTDLSGPNPYRGLPAFYDELCRGLGPRQQGTTRELPAPPGARDLQGPSTSDDRQGERTWGWC